MGRRIPAENRTKSTAAAAARIGAADSSLERAQLFLEAARVALRAREEAALARTLCALLVHPALYAEACIAFVDDTLPARRSYYAGADGDTAKDPERFWVPPQRDAALRALLEGQTPNFAHGACGDRIAPLRMEGRTAGVLALVPTAGRAVGAQEIGEIEALAEDLACALAQLRSDAPQPALAASERRERALLRTIIDALPDLIYVKDAAGRLTLGNAAWLKARLLEAEDVPGKTVFDIFPPEVAQRMDAQDRKIMASGEAIVDQEVQVLMLDADGQDERRWSLTSKIPMRDEVGNVIGIVGISRDITRRRRLEREREMEHGVARVLSESRSVKDTMPILIRTICEAVGWTYGARWVWDEDAGTLRRAEWWCEFEPQFDPADEPYWSGRGTSRSGGLGLLRNAWLEGRATWCSDIAEVSSFLRKPSCLKLGFRSAFAFPIAADDERLGVMEFFARDVREPDEGLLELSGAISNQIGQFIRRKQAEESLQENEQQLRAMFENADVGIAVTALGTRYLRVNDKFCSIIGYSRDELLRMRAADVQLESNMEEMQAHRSRMISEDVPARTIEKQLVRKDGSFVWVSLATSLVRASDGSPRYFITIIQDVSESRDAAEALRESEEQFRRMAQYDTLTSLPNRGLFHDRLGHAIAHARRDRSMLAVLFVDIDRFKHVNDTFGHAAGDELLRQISQRLSACVRSNDTVGRLSGDEFAIVLSGLAAPEDAATVAAKIVEELGRPYQLEGAELFVTGSVGIAIFPTDGGDPDVLIRNADVAMYQAKERGRNNYQFYMPEMNR